MKLVLKDKTEITITSMSDSYNPKGVADEDKRSVQFSISDPSAEMTIDYLTGVLTKENLSVLQIIHDTTTKTIEPCEVTSIIDNLAEDSHYLTIRAKYIV